MHLAFETDCSCSSVLCSAAATSNGGSPGVYSPPTMGPSALNDNSGVGVLPVAGVAARLVILASSLMALCLSA